MTDTMEKLIKDLEVFFSSTGIADAGLPNMLKRAEADRSWVDILLRNNEIQSLPLSGQIDQIRKLGFPAEFAKMYTERLYEGTGASVEIANNGNIMVFVPPAAT